jgi:ADP-ribosylglycohydrolase
VLKQFVRVSARITHTDPKAEYAAMAVALAAHIAGTGEQIQPGKFLDRLQLFLDDDEPANELVDLLAQAVDSVSVGQTTEEFAADLGLGKGVSGYAYHSVPVAIHAWLAHPSDFREAVLSVIRCGGDADSTGAIVGGIVGCRVGREGIPDKWLQGLWEWPRTVKWIERLADGVFECRMSGEMRKPPRLPVMGVLIRNLLFLVIVLGHGFRRLFPPY